MYPVTLCFPLVFMQRHGSHDHVAIQDTRRQNPYEDKWQRYKYVAPCLILSFFNVFLKIGNYILCEHRYTCVEV